MQVDTQRCPRPTSAGWSPGMPATFTVDAYPDAQVQGRHPPDPERAADAAERRDLRRGHRRRQRRPRAEARHDRERHVRLRRARRTSLRIPNAALRFRPPEELLAAGGKGERRAAARTKEDKGAAASTAGVGGSVGRRRRRASWALDRREAARRCRWRSACRTAARSRSSKARSPKATCDHRRDRQERARGKGKTKAACSERVAARCPTMDRTAPLIEIADVTKTYRMGEVEVRGAARRELDVAPGEFVAIMGPSGLRQVDADEHPRLPRSRRPRGSYRLDGRETFGAATPTRWPRSRNRTLGFVFQSFNLLSRTTALENVELPLVYAGVPPRERRERAHAALERVGLGDAPGPPSQPALRRPAAAGRDRARAGQPAHADPGRRADRQPRLARPATRSWRCSRRSPTTGITIVLVTHEPDIAAYAARVIVVRDGRSIADGAQMRAGARSGARRAHTRGAS